MEMVTIKGVRYQQGDAERLGLIQPAPSVKKAPTPQNKSRGAATISTKKTKAQLAEAEAEE